MSSATAKGQIIPKHSSEIEDYICKLILDEHGLIIERSEYLKENECLYNVPLSHIIEFDFLNEQQQKKSIVKSIFTNIIGVFFLIISGTGFTQDAANIPDILLISFYNNNGEIVKLVFNMMDFGEGNIAKYYKKLTSV